MNIILFSIIGTLIDAPWWYWLIIANYFIVKFFNVCDDEEE